MRNLEGWKRLVASIPWGLVGMLAIVAGVERFIALNERRSFQESLPASWEQSARASTGAAVRNAQILCFGDSMIKFGVAPLVLQEQTGLTAYNLAPFGGPPAASYFLLRRAIEAGASPRLIVADFMLHGLADPPQQFVRSWQGTARPVEALDLAWTTGDWSFLGELALGRVLASVRARPEIRRSTLLALKGESFTTALDHYVRPLWRNWKIHRGGQLLAPVAFDGRADPGDKALFPPKWKSHPASAQYMKRFLDLAAQRRIPVLWLIPPLAPATQALREELGVDRLFESLVRATQARYPNVVVVDARKAGFPDAVFTDPVHLDRYGTAALSVNLSQVIREEVLGKEVRRGWVSLPGMPGERVEVPWEDVDQTRLAIQAETTSRRR